MKENAAGESKSPLRIVLAGLLGGLAIGLVIIFGIPGAEPTQRNGILDGSGQGYSRPLVGQPAPEFSSITADGDPISLADYSGQIRLLNFWATWCGPCEIEMPYLQDRYTRWRDAGLVILAVNFDESAEVVAAYGRDLNLDFPLILDPGGEIQQSYLVRGYPTSYLVDRDGAIIDVHVGLLTEQTLDRWLASVGLED